MQDGHMPAISHVSCHFLSGYAWHFSCLMSFLMSDERGIGCLLDTPGASPVQLAQQQLFAQLQTSEQAHSFCLSLTCASLLHN